MNRKGENITLCVKEGGGHYYYYVRKERLLKTAEKERLINCRRYVYKK